MWNGEIYEYVDNTTKKGGNKEKLTLVKKKSKPGKMFSYLGKLTNVTRTSVSSHVVQLATQNLN